MRELFQRWAKVGIKDREFNYIKKEIGDSYEDREVHFMWLGWKAGYAAGRQKALKGFEYELERQKNNEKRGD